MFKSESEMQKDVDDPSKASKKNPNRNKNLTQDQVKNPNRKIKQAIQIADGVYIGDRNSSSDAIILKSNHISRILNTAHNEIINIFDPNEAQAENVQAFFAKKGEQYSSFVGQIQYLNFTWEDLQVPANIQTRSLRKYIFDFIEAGVKEYKSVMIVSSRNQCRSIIVAQIYLMMKYRWNAVKTLEYLCVKKPNISITSEIVKMFMKVEADLLQEYKDEKKKQLSLRSNWMLDDLSRNPVNEKTIIKEEEASMINCFSNCQFEEGEVEVERRARRRGQKKPVEDRESSIKQFIQDALIQSKIKFSENTKTLCWNDVQQKETGKVLGEVYMIEEKTMDTTELFQQSHFIREKKRRPKQRLTVVNEKTIEETLYSQKYSSKFGDYDSSEDSANQLLNDLQFIKGKDQKKPATKNEKEKPPSSDNSAQWQFINQLIKNNEKQKPQQESPKLELVSSSKGSVLSAQSTKPKQLTRINRQIAAYKQQNSKRQLKSSGSNDVVIGPSLEKMPIYKDTMSQTSSEKNFKPLLKDQNMKKREDYKKAAAHSQETLHSKSKIDLPQKLSVKKEISKGDQSQQSPQSMQNIPSVNSQRRNMSESKVQEKRKPFFQTVKFNRVRAKVILLDAVIKRRVRTRREKILNEDLDFLPKQALSMSIKKLMAAASEGSEMQSPVNRFGMGLASDTSQESKKIKSLGSSFKRITSNLSQARQDSNNVSQSDRGSIFEQSSLNNSIMLSKSRIQQEEKRKSESKMRDAEIQQTLKQKALQIDIPEKLGTQTKTPTYKTQPGDMLISKQIATTQAKLAEKGKTPFQTPQQKLEKNFSQFHSSNQSTQRKESKLKIKSSQYAPPDIDLSDPSSFQDSPVADRRKSKQQGVPDKISYTNDIRASGSSTARVEIQISKGAASSYRGSSFELPQMNEHNSPIASIRSSQFLPIIEKEDALSKEELVARSMTPQVIITDSSKNLNREQDFSQQDSSSMANKLIFQPSPKQEQSQSSKNSTQIKKSQPQNTIPLPSINSPSSHLKGMTSFPASPVAKLTNNIFKEQKDEKQKKEQEQRTQLVRLKTKIEKLTKRKTKLISQEKSTTSPGYTLPGASIVGSVVSTDRIQKQSIYTSNPSTPEKKNLNGFQTRFPQQEYVAHTPRPGDQEKQITIFPEISSPVNQRTDHAQFSILNKESGSLASFYQTSGKKKTNFLGKHLENSSSSLPSSKIEPFRTPQKQKIVQIEMSSQSMNFSSIKQKMNKEMNHQQQSSPKQSTVNDKKFSDFDKQQKESTTSTKIGGQVKKSLVISNAVQSQEYSIQEKQTSREKKATSFNNEDTKSGEVESTQTISKLNYRQLEDDPVLQATPQHAVSGEETKLGVTQDARQEEPTQQFQLINFVEDFDKQNNEIADRVESKMRLIFGDQKKPQARPSSDDRSKASDMKLAKTYESMSTGETSQAKIQKASKLKDPSISQPRKVAHSKEEKDSFKSSSEDTRSNIRALSQNSSEPKIVKRPFKSTVITQFPHNLKDNSKETQNDLNKSTQLTFSQNPISLRFQDNNREFRNESQDLTQIKQSTTRSDNSKLQQHPVTPPETNFEKAKLEDRKKPRVVVPPETATPNTEKVPSKEIMSIYKFGQPPKPQAKRKLNPKKSVTKEKITVPQVKVKEYIETNKDQIKQMERTFYVASDKKNLDMFEETKNTFDALQKETRDLLADQKKDLTQMEESNKAKNSSLIQKFQKIQAHNKATIEKEAESKPKQLRVGPRIRRESTNMPTKSKNQLSDPRQQLKSQLSSNRDDLRTKQNNEQPLLSLPTESDNDNGSKGKPTDSDKIHEVPIDIIDNDDMTAIVSQETNENEKSYRKRLSQPLRPPSQQSANQENVNPYSPSKFLGRPSPDLISKRYGDYKKRMSNSVRVSPQPLRSIRQQKIEQIPQQTPLTLPSISSTAKQKPKIAQSTKNQQAVTLQATIQNKHALNMLERPKPHSQRQSMSVGRQPVPKNFSDSNPYNLQAQNLKPLNKQVQQQAQSQLIVKDQKQALPDIQTLPQPTKKPKKLTLSQGPPAVKPAAPPSASSRTKVAVAKLRGLNKLIKMAAQELPKNNNKSAKLLNKQLQKI